MKFLTFDQIKQQLRLDDEQATAEQSILEMYAASAEDSVLNIIRRSYEDVLETFGGVPTPIKHAALMLTDHWYQHRSPVTPGSVAQVPYTYDLLLKPYMRLSGDEYDNNNNQGYGRHCNL